MTKNEKQNIKKFIGEISNKRYSEANKALEAIVSDKLKTQIRATLASSTNK
jgi:hypothetical protein